MKVGVFALFLLCLSFATSFAGEVSVVEVQPGEVVTAPFDGDSVKLQSDARVEISPSGEKRHFINREIVHSSKASTPASKKESTHD